MNVVSVYDEPEGLRVLWALLRERSTESDPHTNISHREMPTWEAHCKHVKARPHIGWWLLHDGREWLGAVHVTDRNEIGIALFRKHRGQGYGAKAVRWVLDNVKPRRAVKGRRRGTFVANINPHNERSIRLFEGLGFKHVQNTYVLE